MSAAPVLTERQLTVLRAISSHIEKRGRPPSETELSRAVGIRRVAGHLLSLEHKGLIGREYGKAKTITITPAGAEAIGAQPTAGGPAPQRVVPAVGVHGWPSELQMSSGVVLRRVWP